MKSALDRILGEEIHIPINPDENIWPDPTHNIIKVIGVGGGGGNAVKNMYQQGVHNVAFAVCNTDSQALSRSEIPNKLQLGENGLGVGGNPAKGREAAMSSIEAIKGIFGKDTKMVFITAGMGGGTGTGAAPVIAKTAKDMGILTVGVVTLPFAFEKHLRIEKALLGVNELKKNVDALLVINNERLMQIYNDGMTTVTDAFQKADDILTVATKSIAEIITKEGQVNRDFCDVQTVLKDGGGAIMSEGRASGENRILKAMHNALNSPLLNNVEIERAQRLLYIIYQSKQRPVLINELNEINGFMDNLACDLEVLWGLYNDDSLGDDVKVTLIATGFDKKREEEAQQDCEQTKELFIQYYGDKRQSKPEPEPVEEQKEEPAEDVAEADEGDNSTDTPEHPLKELSDEIEKEETKEEIDASEEEHEKEDSKRNWAVTLMNWLEKACEA